MAPGLRSGRTGHPRVAGTGGADPGGCSPQRTDAGGEGRCLRTRLRVGAAGMLANCLLSVAVLLLLVRCSLAAEGKHAPSRYLLQHAVAECDFYAFTFFTSRLWHLLWKNENMLSGKWIFCLTRAAFCNPLLGAWFTGCVDAAVVCSTAF